MDGLLVIDKPTGPTSHDVVARMRRVLGERRIGHTGTLDPAASGVLPLVMGRATRLARFLSASDKGYEAVIRLGVATDTDDADGAPIGAAHEGALPSRADVEHALDEFRGSVLQRPPAYSAKKIDGTRAYVLARRRSVPSAGRVSEPVRVRVYRLEIISLHGDRVTIGLECSSGFYVRALARDLGERLGTGGHLTALRRTRSGDLTLAEALPLDTAERDRSATLAAIVPLARMLQGLAAVVLTDEGVRRAAHGHDLGPDDIAGALPPQPRVRLLDRRGELLGIAEAAETPGLLHPSVVLM